MMSPADSPARSDLVLLARIHSGDVAALESRLTQYWESLEIYADQLLPGEDAPEDDVQEAFIRLWEHRKRWRLEGSVRALLYTITRRAALDQRKRTRRRQRTHTSSREASRSVPTPAEQVEGDGTVIAGTTQWIAEVMGISVQTVANHFSLALADLRRSLEDFLDVENGHQGESSQPDEIGMTRPRRRVNGD